MKNDFLKATIDHNRNIKDNIFTALIITIGGTISLVLHPSSILNNVFVILGVFASIKLISGYVSRYQIIKEFIKKLKDKD